MSEEQAMSSNNFHANDRRPLMHEEIDRLLAAYTAGELEPAERGAVELHIAKCDICQQALAEVQQIRQLLRTIAPATPLSSYGNARAGNGGRASLVDAVMAQLTDQAPEVIAPPIAPAANTPPVRKRRKLQRTLSLIAAAILLALLVGSMAAIFNLARQSKSGETNNTNPAYNKGIYLTALGSLYKLDTQTRALIWHKTFGTGQNPSTVMQIDGPVVDNGVVYFSGSVGAYPTIPYLYALNAKDGSVLWHVRLASKVVTFKQQTPPNGPQRTIKLDLGYLTQPLIIDGKVIVLSRTGQISAFNAANGDQLWTENDAQLSAIACTSTSIPGYSNCGLWSAFEASDNGVFYVTMQNMIQAINAANGTKLWTAHALAKQFTTGLATANGLVYATSQSSLNPGLNPPTASYAYAFNASNGSQLWATAKIAGPLTGPVVSNGIVCFGTSNGSIYTLEASSGTLIWQKNITGLITTDPIVVNGIIYAGAGYAYYAPFDHIVALNAANGATLWQINQRIELQAVSNGVVYSMADSPPPPPTTKHIPVHGEGAYYNNTIFAYKTTNGSELWRDQYTTSYNGPTDVTVVP